MLELGNCGLPLLISVGKRGKTLLPHVKVPVQRSILLEFSCRVAKVSSWREFSKRRS